MTENLREQAAKLAARPYTLRVLRDDSEPEEPLYVALNPELDGCMAQGTTIEEAEISLNAFRIAYIEHLLQHGLPVPEPATMTTSTSAPVFSKLHKTINARQDADESAETDSQSQFEVTFRSMP